MAETLIQYVFVYGGQVAFALSPVAAYLPQYWTVCRELRRNEEAPAGLPSSTAPKGRCSNHRNSFRDPLLDESSLLDGDDDDGGGGVGKSVGESHKGDVGFSSVSILVLLMAHVLRLEYLYGCQSQSQSQSQSRFRTTSLFSDPNDNLNNIQIPSPDVLHEARHNRGAFHPPIQLDLMAQSLVMIVMQTLLLTANIRARNSRGKLGLYRKKTRTRTSISFTDLGILSDTPYTQEKTMTTLLSSSNVHPPLVDTSCTPLVIHGTKRRKQSTHETTRNHDEDLIMIRQDPTSATSFTKSKSHHPLSSEADTYSLTHTSPSKHVYYDIYPDHEISSSTVLLLSNKTSSPCPKLRNDSQMIHGFILLLILSSILLCHYLFFHMFHGLYILCTLSIILESSLALPTLYLNFQKRDTRGLSFWMVCGWIVGDFLKLFYFTTSTSSSSSSQTMMKGIFTWGCILAITMDTLVAMQMIFWYPTRDVVELKEYLKRAYKRWFVK